MPKAAHPCLAAFDAARAFRRTTPLASGRYKLVEACKEIDQVRKTVDRIAETIREPNRFRTGQGLGKCTMDDRAKFLKQIPVFVAALLGRKIVPGIAALAGDGVPAAEAAREARKAVIQAEALLARCEALHARLKAGIQPEYEALKRGDSELVELLDDAEDAALAGLRKLEAASEAL